MWWLGDSWNFAPNLAKVAWSTMMSMSWLLATRVLIYVAQPPIRTTSGKSRTNLCITASTSSSSGRDRSSGDIVQQFAVQGLEQPLCLPGRKIEEVGVNLAARGDSSVPAQERIGLKNQQVSLAAPRRKSPPDFIPIAVHDHLLVIGDQVASFVQNESRVRSWDDRNRKSSLDLAYGHRDSGCVDDVAIEVALNGPHDLEPLGIQHAEAAGAAAHGADCSRALESFVDRGHW